MSGTPPAINNNMGVGIVDVDHPVMYDITHVDGIRPSATRRAPRVSAAITARITMAEKRNRVVDAQRRKAIVARTGSLQIANSVLTLEKVVWVKQQLAEGKWGRREIGQAVGVSTESIAKIARGDTWGHVPWPEGVERGELVAPSFEVPAAEPVRGMTKEEEQASIARVFAKAGVAMPTAPQIEEDSNEAAKKLLLGDFSGVAERSDAAEAPENLDELP